MLIVDSQIHLWRNDNAPPHHRRAPYLADEAITAMDAAGVARSVNCPAIWDDGANDYADEVARAYPTRFATLGWFPLALGAEEGFVEQFLARPGMLGLRFVIMRPEDCQALADGMLDPIWAVADRLGRPVAIMAPKPLLPVVGETARRFANVRWLLDHLAIGPFEKLPDAMSHLGALEALAKIPNVAVKASATPSMSNAGYPYEDVSDPLHRIFDAFGRERFFWGTDITRMPIPLSACVEMFTRHLSWLGGADLEHVMGSALCEWIGWNPS
ncbi:hypothetical protein GCM10009087_36130 [Sphingomonas oligophenolica]|uniref:Amidohydrolase family protein n=1 Tax=Sphingomonas oligophenolica TaxID=301154 RepID=A0ABU9Y991_9SPHN